MIKHSLLPPIALVSVVFVCSYICSLLYLNLSTIVSFIDGLFRVAPNNYTGTMGFTVLLVLFLVFAFYYFMECEINNNPSLNLLVGVCVFFYIAMLIVILRSMPEGVMTALQLSMFITAYFPVIAVVLLIIHLLFRGK